MDNPDTIRDEVLERQGRVIGRSGRWFLLVGLITAVPGILLVVLQGHSAQRSRRPQQS